jgi:hypothetical protein
MARVVARMTKGKNGWEHHEPRRRRSSFLGPWLLAIVVFFVGTTVHRSGGTTLPGAALLSVLLSGSASALTWMAWRYAAARDPFQRWHVAASVAAGGVAVIALTIFGPARGLIWLYGVGAFTLCVSWNIRRSEVVRGDGTDGRDGGLGEALGLAGVRAKVIEATPERRVSKWRTSGGQTGQDVQKQLPAIAAKAGVGRDQVRAVENPRNAAEATVTMMLKDVLAETLPWEGAAREQWGQRSIAELLHAGRYEDGEQTVWSLVGDYEANIPPSHVVVMGITRAGKTVFAILTANQILDCYDAVLWWSDTAKGSQTAAPIRPGIDWYTDAPNTVKAQLAALKRVAKARADALGVCGYSSWTPAAYADERLRMPALIYWCEEAGPVLDDNPSIVVDLGEACLSSGIFLVWSLQRASHDRMPTSLRYNIGTAVCYGTGDDISASFVLSEATLAAGADPFRWKNRKPGRALIENAAVDEERFAVPFKTFLPDRQAVLEHAQASAGWRAPLDEVSVRAAGETYARREVAAAEVTPTVTDLPDDDVDEEWTVPPQPEPELADLTDPRAVLPPASDEDVDLSPEDDGRPSLSPDQRWSQFRRLLAEFMDRGQTEVRMGDLVEAWLEQLGPFRANQRPHLHNMLNDLIEQGQVERVEGGGGRYRLLMLVSQNGR